MHMMILKIILSIGMIIDSYDLFNDEYWSRAGYPVLVMEGAEEKR